jgi:NhaP-type Na+/H+ or K+/H+ antiporter
MIEANLITIFSVIIIAGVISQIIAARFSIPSVVFLLIFGILLGPHGIDILNPLSFGNALNDIVGISVAIIIFEGAFHIRIQKLLKVPIETAKLLTIGAGISLIGTAALVHYLLNVHWVVSLLVGSLLIATGPTVIMPILKVVPVRERVATILETEGIVNDVTAAILAIVFFEAILLNPFSLTINIYDLIPIFILKFGVGLLVGILTALALINFLRLSFIPPSSAPQLTRLLVLMLALASYAISNSITPGSGIVAAAAAGILSGNSSISYEREVSEFKGDITLLVLSFIFIILAALLDLEILLSLGISGVLVVILIIVLVRSLSVYVSVTGNRFTLSEKIFMMAVAPRGIIPASISMLFAIQLQSFGLFHEANVLVGTVFLVIFTTVSLEAGLSRHIAEYLDVIPMRVIIIGGGRVGRSLSARLSDRGESILIIEQDESQIESLSSGGFSTLTGDGTRKKTLEQAKTNNAKILIAATGDDGSNLLISQLAKNEFGVDMIFSRVNNPDNVSQFEDIGVIAVSSSHATALAIDNIIERPALTAWMTELTRTGDVQEITLTSSQINGKTVSSIASTLPSGCLIALVRRNGEDIIPHGDFVLERGDNVTLLGRKEDVKLAIKLLHPHN